MKPKGDRDYGGELLETLARLEEAHAGLAELIERKINFMRECDVAGMNACTADERELVRKIAEREGRRRALTDRLARSFGMAPARARQMTATQLAEKLPPQQRSAMLEAAGRLKSLTTRIARRNRVAGMLGGQMLKHMDAIQSAMTAPKQRSGAYSPAGRAIGASPQRLFETVG